jgi:hypothetical protein
MGMLPNYNSTKILITSRLRPYAYRPSPAGKSTQNYLL